MGTLERALERNKAWAARMKKADPGFFQRLTAQQTPQYLWIGCSDSRVPANQIIDMPPGEVFVHRNIANVVSPSDLNLLSVLQYAVDVLRVRNIIVCGHYGCGGVCASLDNHDHGLIDNWLNHIRLVSRLHADTLDALPPGERADRLCELNVVEQARNVVNTTIVRAAWERGQDLHVYGVIYSLRDGVLSTLTADHAPVAHTPRRATG
ncbi:MAG: carbonic anhydrase [Pseudomonadota bacterium]